MRQLLHFCIKVLFSWFLTSLLVGCKSVGSVISHVPPTAMYKECTKTPLSTKPLAVSKIFTRINFVNSVISCVLCD